MTLKEYYEKLGKIIEENPHWTDLPMVYSIDDEGNRYHIVHADPTPVQVENIKEYDLEVVGFYDAEYDDIAKEDVNCICVN